MRQKTYSKILITNKMVTFYYTEERQTSEVICWKAKSEISLRIPQDTNEN